MGEKQRDRIVKYKRADRVKKRTNIQLFLTLANKSLLFRGLGSILVIILSILLLMLWIESKNKFFLSYKISIIKYSSH